MKIQSPWMGRIKGSAGNMTGCKVYDKNVMRAKAFEVNNPNTAAQQVQRGYFADLTKLVAGFTPDQLRTLFPSKPKAMSRRNALSKQLAVYNTMEGSEKVIDFAEIDTLGNAPAMDFGVTNCQFSNGIINVELDDKIKENQSLANYNFIAAIVNETKEEISLSEKHGDVGNGVIDIDIPSGWETTDTIHAIPLITNETLELADFGSFIIKVRPEKKSN
ncbi:MAG: DUF6266 family protein [Acutalibacteraceae bacterium]|nr:DUF6266 family protein [Acutalibacteraceae bacterium]